MSTARSRHYISCKAVSTAVENLTSQASQRQHEQIMQVFCRRLNDMGCILPSEPTSASVATAALVAQHGQRAALLSDSEIDNAFQSVKIRLKQLYKNEPVKFIQTLPATPGELVRTEHAFALTIFSREEPPADCPPLQHDHGPCQSSHLHAPRKRLRIACSHALASSIYSGVDRRALAMHILDSARSTLSLSIQYTHLKALVKQRSRNCPWRQ